MDVELLARMISELVVDHDEVGLPGVGTFVAELAPAAFSDRGYTINPPYRKLVFRPSRGEDGLLIDFYARMNGLDRDVSANYVSGFLSELKIVLKERKTIVLPGLGRLRATRENDFFFVPDENLDIFPEGIALLPVSLKTNVHEEPVEIHPPFMVTDPELSAEPVPPDSDSRQTQLQEAEPLETAEPVKPTKPTEPAESVELVAPAKPAESAESLAQTRSITPIEQTERLEPAERAESIEQTEQLEPAEPAKPIEQTERLESAEPDGEAGPADSGKRGFRWWMALLLLAGLAVVAIVVFIILARTSPDLIDRLLYTPEELRIIYY